MAIKERHGHRAWVEWDPPFRNVAAWRAERESILRDQEELDRTVQFYRFVQFLFDEHWNELRGHARKRNCLLIGDLPWYVGYDSADVWARREVFDLDEEGHPRFVAGVPPDYFSPTGQLWGNPVYNWSDDGAVEWWEEAISFTLKRVDILRLDHFRAIDTYWQIPWDWARMEKTAINGLWAKGPGEDLLKKIRCRLMRDGLARSGGQLPIIAEDLGGLDPLFATPHDYPHHWSESHKFPVTEAFRQKIERGDGDLQPALNPETGEYSTRQGVDYLLDAYGLPWMAVIQFGLEGADRHHPDHVPHDCVIYTGTHDNDTALGWYETSLRHRRQEAHEKGHQHIDLHEGFPGNPPVTEVDVHIDIDVEPVRILDPLGQPVTIKDEAPERDVPWEMLELVIKSKSALAGAPMQDLLGLGSEARMNLPGDTHGGWWSWRAKLEQMDYEVLSRRLGKLNDDYGRRE
ncbi:4-alpha-glucanotransferase [bacterium]|nr:4-alpha-glucanotransferase [bacterium]